MTTIRSLTAIKNRTLCLQLIINQRHPLLQGKDCTGKVLHQVGVITEISRQDGWCDVCSRRRTIVHLHCCTTMVHQLGYSIGLRRAIIRFGIIRQHIIPVVSRTGRDGRYMNAIRFCSIRLNGTFQFLRILIIHHHLCHGSSHTARNGTIGTIVRGTHIIIRCHLVPLDTTQERSYSSRAGTLGTPLASLSQSS